MTDAPPTDAPPDARIVMRTFGERPGSMTTGVTIDTSISLDKPTMNFGLSEDMSLFGGGTLERALIRFDLSSIAPGTLVVAARLEVELAPFGDDIVGGLALRLAGEQWSETGATWNERQAGTSWTGAGGTASAAIATVGTPGTPAIVFTVPVTAPQGWIDTPTNNFGFIVGAADEAVGLHYHLNASEALILTGRPQLVLDLVQ